MVRTLFEIFKDIDLNEEREKEYQEFSTKLEKLDEILKFNEDDFSWDGKSFIKKI